jgi:hypothetical protein
MVEAAVEEVHAVPKGLVVTVTAPVHSSFAGGCACNVLNERECSKAVSRINCIGFIINGYY